MSPKYWNVRVTLSGADGNAFNIIGLVSGAIRQGVGREQATAFVNEAFACKSHDELIQLCMATVEVA